MPESYVRAVDLHSWMNADLASLRGKLFEGVVNRVPAEHWSTPVDGGGSTINHLLLHLARHQDLAVNTAIRNKPPLFAAHRQSLGLDDARAWAGLPERDDPAVSGRLAPDPLLNYVTAVFAGTAEWVERVGSLALDTVPDTSRRLSQLADLPADELDWLHSMWSDKAVWWLVQWPVIGHGHTHAGEATSLRNRLGFSPF